MRIVFSRLLLLIVLLLPIDLSAQTRGSFSGRPSYLTRTTGSTSFKPRPFTGKTYTAKTTTRTSFPIQKFNNSMSVRNRRYTR